MRRAFAASLAAILVASTGRAEQSQSRIPIELVVSAQPDIRGEITSCLTRELRAFPDVVVAAEDYTLFKINVVALKLEGTARPYVLSIVVEDMTLKRMMRGITAMLAPKLSKQDADLLRGIPVEGAVRSHVVRVTSVDTMQGVCRQEIANIDGSTFESLRRVQRQIEPLVVPSPR